MIQEKQKRFYAALGSLLTAARKSRSMTIAQLANRSEEQFNTIKSIEEGKACSSHHFIWMHELFGIDYAAVKLHMEGRSGKQEENITAGRLTIKGKPVRVLEEGEIQINWSQVPEEHRPKEGFIYDEFGDYL